MGEAILQPWRFFLRTQTEHIIFGTRGKLDTRSDGISNVIFAPRSSRHSEKPEVFYDLVRKASFPPFGEAFQRRPRPDFVNLFARASAAEDGGKVISLRA